MRAEAQADKVIKLVEAMEAEEKCMLEALQKLDEARKAAQLQCQAALERLRERRLDNDQRNFQPQIPASGIVDLKLGGAVDGIARGARWSLGVQNLLDRDYFTYGVASSTTQGTFSAYPLPGRTFMARAGVDF